MAHIWIIDDDDKLNKLLTNYLSGYLFKVSSFTNPLQALESIEKDNIDLIILDLMMPELNGLEVCREIRRNHDTPILMLTARGDVMDRIVGLEMGADDYLPKPFEPRELLARIQTILRRTGRISFATTTVLKFEGLEIHVEKQEVLLDDKPVELTTMEFQLLLVFADKKGKVVSRDALMEHLKGIDWSAYDRSIDVAVSRLRQKLNDDSRTPRFIRTVWGSGYMFIGQKN